MEDAVGAVLGLDLLHLIGDGVESLFPGNLHEVALAGALFAHALHRVQKTRLSLDFLLPGMTHGARTHLDVALPDVLPAAILAAVVGVDRVVRFNGDELVVLHVALQHACRVPAAVCRAGSVEDALPLVLSAAGIDDSLLVHRLLLLLLGAAQSGSRVCSSHWCGELARPLPLRSHSIRPRLISRRPIETGPANGLYSTLNGRIGSANGAEKRFRGFRCRSRLPLP